MKVCVLGHQGMLGHTVARFLAGAGRDVLTVSSRYSTQSSARFIDEITALEPDWCVNCIGLAPRENVSADALMETNGELPAALSRSLPESCGLIHPSTDGVFSASGAHRAFDETPDASDAYGKSKQRAESALSRPNDMVIRCSIIGLDPPGKSRSLLSWFLNAEGAIEGYSNQMWNGITSLQWARIADGIIDGRRLESPRPIQPAIDPAISKLDLLRLIAEIWNRSAIVNSSEAPTAVTRTLTPNIDTPPLAQQLLELKNWSREI